MVAPLITCACLCDVYSSTGCDFIRMDIGFIPVNDVWSDSSAQLGMFSFDSHEADRNKWKRKFNDGCQTYSENFEKIFIASDQTWYMSRIMSYISGISSLVAVLTSWLLTITPLPASFFWPGVLLPAVVLSMLAGTAKFIFFDTQICTEPLWFVDESSPPVAARSCEIGESAVFGIASVGAYFLCTILICFRSPKKRILDSEYGIFIEPGGTIGTDLVCSDPEHGHVNEVSKTAVAASGREGNEHIASQDSQRTRKVKNTTTNSQTIEHTNHTRSTAPFKGQRTLDVPSLQAQPEAKRHSSADAKWNNYGRPIVVTIDDSGHEGGSRSYSDGSTTQSSSKSTGSRGMSNNGMLPPRHNGISTKRSIHNANNKTSDNNSISRSDYVSIGSRRSKPTLLSFPDIRASDTHASDDVSDLGMQSYSVTSSVKNAPSVVAIPRRNRNTFSPGFSHSSGGKKLRHKGGSREDRNDVFLNEQHHQMTSSGSRLDAKRDVLEYMPPLDEMSATRSLEDHGDLINQCVRDLARSFDDSGFRTI